MDLCARILLSCFIETYSPPEKYNYEPTVPYKVIALPSAELQKACWMGSGGMSWTWACVFHGSNTIYIDEVLEGEPREIILAHEKAHINGWRH